MNRVHDHKRDWLAMSPKDADCGDRAQGCLCRGRLPAVGDVIANTRTFCDHPHHSQHTSGGNYTALTVCRRCGAQRDGYGYTPWENERPDVWADPPFLRVTDVLPIVNADEPPDDDDDGSRHEVMMSLRTRAMWIEYGNYSDRWERIITLPGAVPGGWAIRVEPDDRHNELARLDPRVLGPPPTGRPLNAVAA